MVARLLAGRRLLVIFLVVLLPFMFVGRAYITQVPRLQIQFNEQERMGVLYIRPVTGLLSEITQVRQGSGGDVDAAVATVDAVDARYGEALRTSRTWRTWKNLLASVRSHGTPTFDQYNRLTRGLVDLVTHVANTSNLILDPDLDSYYLMDLVVVRQPILLDQVGRAVQLATSGSAQADNHDLLVVARFNIASTADAIARDLTTSSDNTHDPTVRAATTQPGAAFAASAARTLRLLESGPARGRQGVDGSGLVASANTLYAVSTQRLDNLIAGRIATLQSGVGTTTQVVVLLSVLLMLLATERNRAVLMVRRRTDELQHQSLHDAHTGLANRAAFDQTLPGMLKNRRRGERGPALFLLDIDEFKTVNDRYGHHIGDELLRLTAQRLNSLVRESDLVVRLGGDEFAVIVDNSDVPGAMALAGRMTVALTEPAELDGVHLTPAVSVGVYVPDEKADAEQSLICADAAMYFAKSTGGGCQLFDPKKHRSFIERYQLELELRAATQHGQLELHYQPIVDLVTQQIVAVEALIRWNHPTRGFLHPEDFIKVAEESGAIVDLGHWVLAQACADGHLLVGTMSADRPFKIAVNLSRRQLVSQTLADDVSKALLATSLSPQRLTLEVTETALMHDEDVMMGLLHNLKALGVELAMDDFGTGYSSLAQLRTMPVDVLKIDRAFVGGSAGGEEEWAFAAAIISLAHSLGKRTLAEGIEHPSQLAHLRSLGCELGQGYLFGRPMPLREFIGLLSSRGDDHPSPATVTAEVGPGSHAVAHAKLATGIS